MTKEKFIRIQSARGYKVEDLGRIVILSLDNYTAIWFFNADGTQDLDNPPTWSIDRRN